MSDNRTITGENRGIRDRRGCTTIATSIPSRRSSLRGQCGACRMRSPRASRKRNPFRSFGRRPSWKHFSKAFTRRERVATPASAGGKCEPQTYFPTFFSLSTKVRGNLGAWLLISAARTIPLRRLASCVQAGRHYICRANYRSCALYPFHRSRRACLLFGSPARFITSPMRQARLAVSRHDDNVPSSPK
jgi:hypothetical protein